MFVMMISSTQTRKVMNEVEVDLVKSVSSYYAQVKPQYSRNEVNLSNHCLLVCDGEANP